jgi:type IV secretory pathway VirB4 component
MIKSLIPHNKQKARSNRTELVHFLNWGYIVRKERWITTENKIEIVLVIHKDGCIQTSYGFRGQDLDSYSPSYIHGVAAYMNSVVKRLGDGWMISVEAQRFMTNDYPISKYENLAAYLVDSERAENFRGYGDHYDSNYFMTFVMKPDLEITKKVNGMFIKDSGYAYSMEKEIEEFIKQVENITE